MTKIKISVNFPGVPSHNRIILNTVPSRTHVDRGFQYVLFPDSINFLIKSAHHVTDFQKIVSQIRDMSRICDKSVTSVPNLGQSCSKSGTAVTNPGQIWDSLSTNASVLVGSSIHNINHRNRKCSCIITTKIFVQRFFSFN